MYGYIYLTTNLINGKKYIGQKKSNIFLGNDYLGSGVILLKAVNKYGKNNFSVKLIATAESKEQLDNLEIKYIKTYREANENLYNIADGGYTLGGYLGNTTKNKIWVNNGREHVMIDKHELNTYIALGYKRGSLNTRGYVWVSNEINDVHIPKNELESYLSSGYKLGRLHFRKHWVTDGNIELFISTEDKIPDGFHSGRISTSRQPSRGMKFMYKDKEEILVAPECVDTYIHNGYQIGRHPRHSIKGKKGYSTTSGYKWVTNDVENVFTPNYSSYINQGYRFGRNFNISK